MPESNQQDFLRTLLGMEKTYSNVWDSAHWLFGIQENQYCTNTKWAIKILEKLQDHYNILQIWKETTFQYCDTYMDSLQHNLFKKNLCHNDAHISVRARNNISTKTNTFQIINTTNQRKSIYHYTPSQDINILSNENITFFNWMYNSLTGKNSKFLPIPTIQVCFKRVILYSKKRAERINLDFDIEFTHIKSGMGKTKKLKNLVIIESKSLDWQSHRFSKTIKKHKIKEISHTSKFLLWMHLLHDKKLKGNHKNNWKGLKKLIKKK